jgi:hypothetical protein
VNALLKKMALIARDLWIYFKAGHGGYLVYTMSIINFVVIQQRLLIEQIPMLNQWIGNLTTFFVLFCILYFPTAIIIGYMEYKKGEVKRKPMLNPYTQDILTVWIGLNNGMIELSEGRNDEAKKLFEKNLKLLDRWIKKPDDFL